jgi:hypothetical protein
MRDLVNWIRGNIVRLRNENFPLSQEIGIIKQTEGWTKELMNMLIGREKKRAEDLLYDLQRYRILYLQEYQKKGTLNAGKLDVERKRVLGVAVGHLKEILA